MKKDYWQLIRGICIILVILIHTLYPTDNILINYGNIVIRKIINFVVATFIFMAGYFTNAEIIKDFYKKKIFRLLPALLIWNFIYTLVWAVSNKPTILTAMKSLIISSNSGHLYYIYVLIQLFVIAPLLIKFIRKYKKRKIVFIPLLITPIYNTLLTYINIKYVTTIPLYQYYIFGWFSYYYFGLLAKEKIIKNGIFTKKEIFNLLTALSLSIVEGIIIYSCFNNYDIAISQLGIINFFYSILICKIFYSISTKKIKANEILVKLGDYSFGIYLSHILVLRIVSKISNILSLNYIINIIIKYIITIIICYITNKVYYKYVKGKILCKR